MAIFEQIAAILRDMWSVKLRSFLGLFGIMWGTISVVLLLALGQGFYASTQDRLSVLVNGGIMGAPGSSSESYQGLPKGRQVMLKASDIIRIPKVIPGVKDASPVMGGWGKSANFIRYGMLAPGRINGVSKSYANMMGIPVMSGGRFLNAQDIKHKRQVIVLGSGIARALFPVNTNVIGRVVYFQGIPFLIVGVQVKDKPSQWTNDTGFIPYTTYIEMFGDDNVSSFVIMPKNPAEAGNIQNMIKRYWSRVFHFNIKDKQAIRFFDLRGAFEFFQWFFTSIQMFLGFCGLLTLAVGGISVANMMFLIVTERTPEIGLRLALGAKDSHILGQILIEAFVIVFLGGLLGFLISGAFLGVLNNIQLPSWIGKPELSWQVLLGTVIVLAVVAFLSGFFPARKASKLAPVEALSF